MRSLSTTAWMRFLLSKILTPLDMQLKGTRFAPSTFGMDMPLCYLTTVGAQSGLERTVPLLFIEADSGATAVAATNFGTDRHPGWAYNLEANPRATIEIEGRTKQVVARAASDTEKAQLWPRFDGVWPGYEQYREIAPRDIKMFLLDSPRDAN